MQATIRTRVLTVRFFLSIFLQGLVSLLGVTGADAAFLPPPSRHKSFLDRNCNQGRSFWSSRLVLHSMGSPYNDNDDYRSEIHQLREKATNARLLRTLFNSGGGRVTKRSEANLMELDLVGRGLIGQPPNATKCLFLTTSTAQQILERTEDGSEWTRSVSALALPLSASNYDAQLKLLSFAYVAKPISKSLCLTLNPILVNRDGSLFDNLPWDTWTVDPQMRNRDAAGNSIEKKFHLGKRDAYNRFMGKDWKGRSLSLGNMALRAKYLLEQEAEKEERDGVQFDDKAASSLAERVLELEIREARMALAEREQRVAILRTALGLTPDDAIDAIASSDKVLEGEMEILKKAMDDAEAYRDRIRQSELTLDSLVNPTPTQAEASKSMLSSLLEKIADASTDDGRNAAPYRGAMGYSPILDTAEEMFDESVLPYTSPYDLMKEIVRDQLHAEVIGAVLENTSLFEGTLLLGGAIVLRRRDVKKNVVIDGERVEMSDSEEDFGNEGLKAGKVVVVECDGDEAIGMALACGIPISVEWDIWEMAQMSVVRATGAEDQENKNVMNSLMVIEPEDKELIIRTEGQGENNSTDGSNSPLRAPRTSASLFESFFSSSSSSESSSVFSSANPVQSLSEWDSLSNAEKAKILLSLESFKEKLPRPRALREAEAKPRESSKSTESELTRNPLNKMLLPFIDESVRRQLLVRDAEQRGDVETVNELRKQQSNRQQAKELAERAREDGSDALASMWEEEAALYGSLRADVTQDEGSYSRFLDRDEWYERNRQASAKKLKKSNFGTLLDGIE